MRSTILVLFQLFQHQLDPWRWPWVPRMKKPSSNSCVRKYGNLKVHFYMLSWDKSVTIVKLQLKDKCSWINIRQKQSKATWQIAFFHYRTCYSRLQAYKALESYSIHVNDGNTNSLDKVFFGGREVCSYLFFFFFASEDAAIREHGYVAYFCGPWRCWG